MLPALREKALRFEGAEDVDLNRRVVSYLHLRFGALDTVRVETYHGTATLSGTVPSASVQWQCLDCCRHVAGVLHVVDRLAILPPGGHPVTVLEQTR